jgi:hypothetical protein
MPHDDVASFYLATPWHYVSGKDLGELPYINDMHYMPWSGLTYDEKDQLLATMAVADNNLYNNSSIKAPAKYYMDRIWNAGVRRISHKQAG